MKNHYKSQTGNIRFYWIKNEPANKWFLFQTRLLKSGKPAQTASERVVFKEPENITERRLVEMFAEIENDIIFRDAAGIKGEPQKDKLSDYL